MGTTRKTAWPPRPFQLVGIVNFLSRLHAPAFLSCSAKGLILSALRAKTKTNCNIHKKIESALGRNPVNHCCIPVWRHGEHKGREWEGHR